MDFESYNIIVERKHNKNLYIRINDDLSVKITCPYFYTNKMIEKTIEENKLQIDKMIERQKKKNAKNDLEENCLLGKKIDIIYQNVTKACYNNNVLIIRDKKMLDKWYKDKAKELFRIYLDEAYYAFDEKIPYPILKVRSMKTRWGVCSRKDNSITLNLELIKKDHKYLNYVCVHELSHFVHFNHSKAFWNTVEKYCPLYKEVRKELNY